MKPLSSLLSTYQVIPQKGVSERGTLLEYFAKHMKRPVKLIGIRTSHYTIDQLYGLRATFKDRLERNGLEPAQKYFWWTIKTTKAA